MSDRSTDGEIDRETPPIETAAVPVIMGIGALLIVGALVWFVQTAGGVIPPMTIRFMPVVGGPVTVPGTVLAVPLAVGVLGFVVILDGGDA